MKTNVYVSFSRFRAFLSTFVITTLNYQTKYKIANKLSTASDLNRIKHNAQLS